MRILLDYRPALRLRTGVGEYVHELAAALQSLLSGGDRLTLFSSSLRDRVRGQPVRGADVIDRRIPVSVLNYAWHRLQWPPVEALAGAIDVVHAAHPLLIPARRAAQAVTVHDLDYLDHPERTRAEIRRDYPSLTADHARRADLVVAVSEYTAAQIRTRFDVPPDRLIVCRPGAPRWPRRAPPRSTGPILFVGTLEPRKNVDALLQAYARVIARRPDAPPLVLAGRTVEQSAPIVAAAARTPGVQLLGYVSEEQRRRLYLDASMLVLPSLEEGFGLPALEAMTVGVPLIASRRGALPEVAGQAGLLIDPLDTGALAEAIEAVLAQPERRLQMADAGFRQSRLFDWKKSAEALLAAYRTAIARRHARVG